MPLIVEDDESAKPAAKYRVVPKPYRQTAPRLKDPYHIPIHQATHFSEAERSSLLEYCRALDEEEDGCVKVEGIEGALRCIGEPQILSLVRKELISLVQSRTHLADRAHRKQRPGSAKARLSQGTVSTGGGLEHEAEEELRAAAAAGDTTIDTVSFADLVHVVVSIREGRNVWGGRRSIRDNYIHLPPCCKSNYCAAHLERPPTNHFDDAADLQKGVLMIIFRRHDVDDSGALEFEELPKIFESFGIPYDTKKLRDTFTQYDVDNSGELDFQEFTAMVKDLKAMNALTEGRMATYDLPPGLRSEFTKAEIETLMVNFGLFDDSGDGAIDEVELEQLLRNFGQNPTKEKVHEVMEEIDYDRNGTIDFKEFAALMLKVRDGLVDLDDSAFGRAVMNSATASLLSGQVSRLQEPEHAVEWCGPYRITAVRPATCDVCVRGPAGSVYEGGTFRLEIIVNDGFPYVPPHVKFRNRMFHLNFNMLLDGSTGVAQLLDLWTASWDLEILLRRIVDLMKEPDPSLLPSDLSALAAPPTQAHGPRQDLREKKRSGQLAAQVASMYFSQREAYDQTARRFAALSIAPGSFKAEESDKAEGYSEAEGGDEEKQ